MITHQPRVGSRCKHAILDETLVAKIKTDILEKKLTNKAIAEKFGVAQYTISSIKNGVSWTNVRPA